MFGEQIGSSLMPLTMSSAIIEFDQFTPDWSLAQLSEEGVSEPRSFTAHVDFDTPFGNVPIVHVGISGFDIDNCDTSRLSVRTSSISPTGFDLVIQTWLTTRVYKVEISWLALGGQAVYQ